MLSHLMVKQGSPSIDLAECDKDGTLINRIVVPRHEGPLRTTAIDFKNAVPSIIVHPHSQMLFSSKHYPRLFTRRSSAKVGGGQLTTPLFDGA